MRAQRFSALVVASCGGRAMLGDRSKVRMSRRWMRSEPALELGVLRCPGMPERLECVARDSPQLDGARAIRATVPQCTRQPEACGRKRGGGAVGVFPGRDGSLEVGDRGSIVGLLVLDVTEAL